MLKCILCICMYIKVDLLMVLLHLKSISIQMEIHLYSRIFIIISFKYSLMNDADDGDVILSENAINIQNMRHIIEHLKSTFWNWWESNSNHWIIMNFWEFIYRNWKQYENFNLRVNTQNFFHWNARNYNFIIILLEMWCVCVCVYVGSLNMTVS